MQTGLRVPDIAQCLHLFLLRAMQMGLRVPDCGQYFRFPIISPSYEALTHRVTVATHCDTGPMKTEELVEDIVSSKVGLFLKDRPNL